MTSFYDSFYDLLLSDYPDWVDNLHDFVAEELEEAQLEL